MPGSDSASETKTQQKTGRDHIDDVDRYYVYGWSGVNKYRDCVESNIAFNLDSLEPGSLVSPWGNVDKDAPELKELETLVYFEDFHEYMTMSSVEIDAAYEALSQPASI